MEDETSPNAAEQENFDDDNLDDDNLEDDDNDAVGDFIDMNDAVEVKVDDDDVPMEDDDDDDDDDDEDGAVNMDDDANMQQHMEEETLLPLLPDMSKFQITSHTDAVYTVSTFWDPTSTTTTTTNNNGGGKLSILTGGGDDKAYCHTIIGGGGTTAATPMVPTTQALPYPHTDTVSSVAYNWPYVSDDPTKTPRYAAVGSYDGTIIIYSSNDDDDDNDNNNNSTTLQQKYKLEGPSDVEWLAWHPKGGMVLLVGSGDGTVWMFHVPLNRCLQVFVGHEEAVTAGAFSPDGKWALTASADGTLRIWAPKTGRNKHVFRFTTTGNGGGSSSSDNAAAVAAAPLTCLATQEGVSGSDGMLVLVGAENGQAHVCHIGTKKVVATLAHFDAPLVSKAPPSSGGGGGSEEEDDDDDEMEYPSSIEAVGFSPSHPQWCATGGVDGKLKIWDLSRDGQCRQVCVPPPPPHSASTSTSAAAAVAPDSITKLQWHPTLPLVFASSISGTIRVWDGRTGALLHTLTSGGGGGSKEQQQQQQINDMAIQFTTAATAVIVTASDDKIVRVFEVDVQSLLP